MSYTAAHLRAAGWTCAGYQVRARLLWRPPVGAVITRTRNTIDLIARAGALWHIVETWTRQAPRRRR